MSTERNVCQGGGWTEAEAQDFADSMFRFSVAAYPYQCSAGCWHVGMVA